MSFDPWNLPLKIREFIKNPTPKVGVHLGVWGSFPHTLLHSREHEMWLASAFLARTFASPCFDHKPKARVITIVFQESLLLVIEGTLGKNQFL